MSNQAQIELWNGPTSERWAELQPEFDRALGGFGEVTIERLAVRRGERVLDVGCGAGATALALAARVGPTGAVVGLDVSEPLLRVARARALAVPALTFARADATEASFALGFDAIFSRFGVMFFADPVASFQNLRRALLPGGRLGFCCWRALPDNPWCELPFLAARRVLPDEPFEIIPRAPGPFAFAEPDYVRQILTGAGFVELSIEPSALPVPLGDGGAEAAAEVALRIGPTSRLLQNASEEQRALAKEAIVGLLRARSDDAHVSLPGSAWIVSARAPSSA